MAYLDDQMMSEIYHYGVKGMKWGKRKANTTSVTYKPYSSSSRNIYGLHSSDMGYMRPGAGVNIRQGDKIVRKTITSAGGSSSLGYNEKGEWDMVPIEFGYYYTSEITKSARQIKKGQTFLNKSKRITNKFLRSVNHFVNNGKRFIGNLIKNIK